MKTPEKYDTIGKGYNQKRKADPYLLDRMYALLDIQVSHKVLDVGCGTGNYTIGLHQKGVSITGVEPSNRMLEAAQNREPTITWLKGYAEAIPMETNAVDRILASLTLHHWSNLERGFQEIVRVLKPGGKLVIFTATPQQMTGYWLRHYFPQMLADSSKVMPKWALLERLLTQNNFQAIATEKYFIRPDLQDHFMYIGKYQPELYFDPEVRQVISSFSAIANQDEVQRGLQQLREDIDSGKIQEIIQQYENQMGDYLFVHCQL